MGALIEMIGKSFGRLTVIKEIEPRVSPSGWRDRRFLAECACGNRLEVSGHAMRKGNTQSCGCLHDESASDRFTKHGESHGENKTAEYRCLRAMITRCENPNADKYPNYGGRGIKVCKRWRESFEAFLSDMGRKPSPKHSIERINNDGNYELYDSVTGLLQCRWATNKEQSVNRRPRKRP